MTAKQRREGRAFFQQRFAYHVGQGKTAAQALAAAKVDGEKKYGADWATILETLMTLLPLLLALFKK